MEPWIHIIKADDPHCFTPMCVYQVSLTWRVSSVLALVSSNLVPLRGNAPIFCPWAYRSVTSACGGGVTSGRGNGCTVGGATEGRPGTCLNRHKTTVIFNIFNTHTHPHHHRVERTLTRRFDNVIWSGSGNLSTVLVHTPAVSGLSITLDWAL